MVTWSCSVSVSKAKDLNELKTAPQSCKKTKPTTTKKTLKKTKSKQNPKHRKQKTKGNKNNFILWAKRKLRNT